MIFLKTPLDEDRMYEFQPPIGGSWQPVPRSLILADHHCSPNASAADPRHPRLSLSYPVANSRIPHITLQPRTPNQIVTLASSTTTTKAWDDLNGARAPQVIDLNDITQKKQTAEALTSLDRVMATTQAIDHDTSSDGFSPISPTADTRNRPPHSRKTSVPLAPPFMVSAPGKVIVYGEHAVVHGKAAMAAAISLRSYLHVHTLSKSSRTVSLIFPDIDLQHTWLIGSLPWRIFQNPSKKRNYYDLVTSLDSELLESLKPHIESVSPDADPQQRKIHHSSVTSFLYLYLSLGSPKSPACIYALRSTIPLGAGLGSSASVSVCLAAAMLIQAHALSGPHPDQPFAESALQLERINRWAFVGELCIHGSPSGVDNTVSTQGKAVVFQRKDYSQPPSVKPLLRFPTLPLLLINTRQPRSTATEVAKVAALRKAHPEIADSILHAIDRVTQSAYQAIAEKQEVGEDALQHLGELMAVNHGLLAALGVSHPKLERLRAIVDAADAGWTKLTGAGGGGCAITLLKNEFFPANNGNVRAEQPPKGQTEMGLEALERNLQAEGFEKFETTLGGDGIGVLLPAVLQNGREDDRGGEEIDQEKFLRVEEREGLERLVGVLGPGKGVREGWRFWTV